jgi:hypothetical protein
MVSSRSAIRWPQSSPLAVGILDSLRAAAIPCSVVTPLARSSASIGARSAARSRARAAITLGPLARALAVNGLWFMRTPPSETPRAFALASAAFVRSEIAFALCSATAAIMLIVSRFACGKSTASNSTPASISADTNATLRASRSSLAITSVAPCTRHSFRASESFGRSARLPVSISVISAINRQRPPSRWSRTARCCASREGG